MTKSNKIPINLSEPRHIGDGVYVSFDGYHVNIAVNHHLNHAVALDPDVCKNLIEYINQINKQS